MTKTFAHKLLVAAFCALSVLGWLLYNTLEASNSTQLKPDEPRVVALGELYYGEHCASCHGANLEGETENWRIPRSDGLMPAPPHNETGHTWHHRDEVLFRITKLGPARASNLKDYKSAMPAYGGKLTDKQIIAVLSYIKSTWPNEIRKYHDNLNKR